MLEFAVIIPTYNELKNVEKLIPAVLSINKKIDVLIVDDNSPDGTGAFVDHAYSGNERVHILHRPQKQGLGKAYIAGMSWAIKNGYKFLVQMDADFSHRPEDLLSMINQADKYDLIIGSRWVPGGKVVNWGISRKIISKLGSLYASTILGSRIKDWTGGFNLWRCQKLTTIDLDNIQSSGYSFQIEMKYKGINKLFKYVEHPIVFVDRHYGKSKMSKKIILEALIKVWTFKKTT